MSKFWPQNSAQIRTIAVWFWGLGLGVIPFDRVFLFSLFADLQVRWAYLFFFISGLLTAWAEKREYGTRVALYRIHDIAVASPWRYLLLFFLWVNLFAASAEEPSRPILYALGGWFSLVVVAFSAQLLFCERKVHGLVFVPARLRTAFFLYAVAILTFGGSYLSFRLVPGWEWPPFFTDQSDFAIYCTAGLPFLIWDYINPKRHLLPRLLNALSVVIIYAALLLMEVRVLFGAGLAAPVALVVVALFKRIRLQRAFLALFALSLLSVNLVLLYAKIPLTNPTKIAIQREISRESQLLENRVQREVVEGKNAWTKAKETYFLGVGVGNSRVDRGVWLQILAEVGIVGLALYLGFLVALIRRLLTIRHAKEIVVSNVAFISVMIFIMFGSHYPHNPYSLSVWVWYALWGVFGSSRTKKFEYATGKSENPTVLKLVSP